MCRQATHACPRARTCTHARTHTHAHAHTLARSLCSCPSFFFFTNCSSSFNLLINVPLCSLNNFSCIHPVSAGRVAPLFSQTQRFHHKMECDCSWMDVSQAISDLLLGSVLSALPEAQGLQLHGGEVQLNSGSVIKELPVLHPSNLSSPIHSCGQ